MAAALVFVGIWLYGGNDSHHSGFSGGGGYSFPETDAIMDSDSEPEATASADEQTTEEEESIPDSEESSVSQETPAAQESEPAIDVSGDEFGFRYGVSDIINNPSYSRFNSQNYSFYCDLPAHFYRVEGSNLWRSPDDTAQVELIAYVNENGLTPKQALDQYITEIGGSVFYSDTGTDWFAVSLSRDGIEYYEKCFVDDYIRAFEFICPHEYIKIYSGYIEHMEKNFKRTE